MDQPALFYPPRSSGLAFQAGIGVALLAVAGYLFYSGFQGQVGVRFILYLLGALACLVPLALLVYRTYSLVTARYQLERDGLRLRWGLRFEDIPLDAIEWIRPVEDLPGLAVKKLALPVLRWPGSLVGVRHMSGLGEVEYLASQQSGLVLVAASGKIFALSPSDPRRFVQAFDRLTELGSLTPLPRVSVFPTFLAGRAWQDRFARTLILASFVLGLVLLVWVALVIPSRPEISLGFAPGGIPEKPGPVERLLLLPILDGLSFLASLGLGLYFFRRPAQRPVAYLLWCGCALQAVLMLAAMSYLTGL